MNIVEPILYQCKLNPLATAICVPGSSVNSITYGELKDLIYNAARAAEKSGIAPGTVVAIFVADVVLHTSLILGLTLIGATTVSLRDTTKLHGVVPEVILTDAPGRFSETGTVLSVDQSWITGDGFPPDLEQISGLDEDDICRIILTSGSTGDAKGIEFSHRMIANRISNYLYSKGPRFANCSRFFCDLGIATSPGFRYAMFLLSRGGTIYFLGPDPFDILQAIDLHKIQGMGTSPYGLGEFLRYFEADSAFDVGFDHIICQGAMLSRELSRRARARMCQNLYSSYGSTETTTVAFGPARVIDTIPGAVGYIQPGVTVEAISKSGEILPNSREGILRIRSRSMASRYVGDPDASQKFFRDGYFYPGDIGYKTPEGLLVITGRAKTALNIGGDTVSPELVEGIVTSFPNVKEVGVFAVNNDLGIAEIHALIVSSSQFDETALRKYCASKLPPSCVPTHFIVVDALPRGGQGKLERHRLPELAAAKIKGG